MPVSGWSVFLFVAVPAATEFTVATESSLHALQGVCSVPSMHEWLVLCAVGLEHVCSHWIMILCAGECGTGMIACVTV